jgi:hypothetical protein
VRRTLVLLGVFLAFVAIFTLSRHPTTTTTSTSTSTSSTSSSTTTTKPAGTTCLGSDFRGRFNQGQGAAGTIYASVTLTKSTVGSCTLKGWPRLTLQDKLGAQLPVNAVDLPSSSGGLQFSTPQANQSPSLLRLAKGATTNFSLAYSDVPTANSVCDNAVTMNVQLSVGGSTVTVTPTYPLQPCNNGRIWVSPFY